MQEGFASFLHQHGITIMSLKKNSHHCTTLLVPKPKYGSSHFQYTKGKFSPGVLTRGIDISVHAFNPHSCFGPPESPLGCCKTSLILHQRLTICCYEASFLDAPQDGKSLIISAGKASSSHTVPSTLSLLWSIDRSLNPSWMSGGHSVHA